MAKKRVNMEYTPIDYDSIPTPNLHEIQYHRRGYPGYQQGWNGKEISNPKLFYLDGRDLQKSKPVIAEHKTSLEQEKNKNIKSQIKRAFSMKKDNNGKELRTAHKPLKKTKSCDVVFPEERPTRRMTDPSSLYPGLASMIDSYSDSFGYDGRKENLARKFTNESANGHPFGQSYLNNSKTNLPSPNDISNNMSPKKESPSNMVNHKSASNKESPKSLDKDLNSNVTSSKTQNQVTHLMAPYMSYVSLNKESNARVSPKKVANNKELPEQIHEQIQNKEWHVDKVTHVSQKEPHRRESPANKPSVHLPYKETNGRESHENVFSALQHKEHSVNSASQSYAPVNGLPQISSEFQNELMNKVKLNFKENDLPTSNTGSQKTSPPGSTSRPMSNTGNQKTSPVSTSRPMSNTGSQKTSQPVLTLLPMSNTSSQKTSPPGSTSRPISNTGNQKTSPVSTSRPMSNTGSQKTSQPVLTLQPMSNTGSQKTSPPGSTSRPMSNAGSPKSSPVSSSQKLPPAVKPKPKKVQNLHAITEETEKPSIPSLIDLCENILLKLDSWKETKEKVELVSILERLISILMGMIRRKPSITESIASALDSFSFLTSDDDNDDTISLPEENYTSFKLPYKMHIYYAVIFHHLCALNDLVVGFQRALGPLNSKETLYLEKIQQQSKVIDQITHLISTRDDFSLKYVCDRFCESGTADFWKSCATDHEPLHCTYKMFNEALNHLFKNNVNVTNGASTDNYLNMAEVRDGASSKVVNEICELDIYKTDTKVISVFQYVDFFKRKMKSGTITDYLKKCVEEFLMLRILYSKDDLLVITTLQQYWKIPVVKTCIQCLLVFISGDKVSRKGASLHALTKLHEIPENKSTIVKVLIASLEEGNVKIKSGACIALGKLKVQGISKKLIYLYETDALMREAAEVGLKDLGHNLIRR